MLDGWEMQVKSEEDNTNSHSLWVVTSIWTLPNCEPTQTNSCTKQHMVDICGKTHLVDSYKKKCLKLGK